MAFNDIRVFNSPHGGHSRIMHFPMDEAAAFRAGEPVGVNDSGQVTESLDDPTTEAFTGIALAPIEDVQGSVVINNPKTNAAWATNDLIPVYIPDGTTQFICDNFATGGGGVAVVPTVANAIGERAGFSLTSDVYFIDVGTARWYCRIDDVLDANRTSLTDGGGTGVSVVFTIISHMHAQTTTVQSPIAD